MNQTDYFCQRALYDLHRLHFCKANPRFCYITFSKTVDTVDAHTGCCCQPGEVSRPWVQGVRRCRGKTQNLRGYKLAVLYFQERISLIYPPPHPEARSDFVLIAKLVFSDRLWNLLTIAGLKPPPSPDAFSRAAQHRLQLT